MFYTKSDRRCQGKGSKINEEAGEASNIFYDHLLAALLPDSQRKFGWYLRYFPFEWLKARNFSEVSCCLKRGSNIIHTGNLTARREESCSHRLLRSLLLTHIAASVYQVNSQIWRQQKKQRVKRKNRIFSGKIRLGSGLTSKLKMPL